MKDGKNKDTTRTQGLYPGKLDRIPSPKLNGTKEERVFRALVLKNIRCEWTTLVYPYQDFKNVERGPGYFTVFEILSIKNPNQNNNEKRKKR